MPIEIDIAGPKNTSSEDNSARASTGRKSAGSLVDKLRNGSPAMTARERMFFTEQLALLVETGATLQQALRTISEQAQRPPVKSLLEAIATRISEGATFSQALSDYPDSFSTTYVSLVAASEDGGFLDKVLLQLLQMEEKREELRTTVYSALSYPIFLIVFSIAVVAFVLVVVFPKFGAMFTAIYDQLPATTRGLMWFSDVLRAYWIPIVAGIAGLALLIRQWAISEPGREAIDRSSLAIPGVKDVFIQVYLVQSLRVMSLSLSNGVSLVDTLASCKDVVRNRVFRRLFATVETRVQQGAGIAAGFREDKVLPPLVQQMIVTGEESGNLPKVMGRMADFYERELSKKLATLSKMAEPIMLMVMGLVVGILVSSLILPIFKLSRAVS